MNLASCAAALRFTPKGRRKEGGRLIGYDARRQLESAELSARAFESGYTDTSSILSSLSYSFRTVPPVRSRWPRFSRRRRFSSSAPPF